MTYTLPFLRTILQPSQIRFTLDLTFTTALPKNLRCKIYLESRSNSVGKPRITS